MQEGRRRSKARMKGSKSEVIQECRNVREEEMQECRNARKQGCKNEVVQERSVGRWSTLFKRECRNLGLYPAAHNPGCYVVIILLLSTAERNGIKPSGRFSSRP
jgi:hypothetical protein